MYGGTSSGRKRAFSYWAFCLFPDGESGGGSDCELYNHDFTLAFGLFEVLCAEGSDSKVVGVSVIPISFPRAVVRNLQFFDSGLFYQFNGSNAGNDMACVRESQMITEGGI